MDPKRHRNNTQRTPRVTPTLHQNDPLGHQQWSKKDPSITLKRSPCESTTVCKSMESEVFGIEQCIQNVDYRLQSKGYSGQSTECRVSQTWEYKMQHRESRVQSAEHRAQSVEGTVYHIFQRVESRGQRVERRESRVESGESRVKSREWRVERIGQRMQNGVQSTEQRVESRE